MSNIANALAEQAAAAPDKPAIILTRRALSGQPIQSKSISYRDLNARSERIARGLSAVGLGPGVRSVLMVKPSFEFFALMFGLLRAGAVPVLIDPGIDRRSLKTCIDEAQPRGFIGIPLAHLARLVLGWGKAHVRQMIVVPGNSWLDRFAQPLGTPLARIEALADPTQALASVNPDDPAAILFTSGSTGIPKGVVYRHRHFQAQVEMIRAAYQIAPGEIDCPTFPPFALFDPALGVTAVIPDMDFTRPAAVDAGHIFALIEQFGVTQMFGSPALLDTLGRYAEQKPCRAASLKRVLSAGAPMREDIARRMAKTLAPGVPIYTPYGATECLPVASISHFELADTWALTRAGAGVCVGRVMPPNLVRIIPISDAEIADWSEVSALGIGKIGEITVSGPSCTDRYFNRDAANALAKISEGERVVHRMGDVGYFDSNGRLWYCGRKSQRVQTAYGTLYTEQVESIFNTHPAVARSALVGLGERGRERPLVWIQLRPDQQWSTEINQELLEIARAHAPTERIETFLTHAAFPVDIRHNAKIGREKLRLEAIRKHAVK